MPRIACLMMLRDEFLLLKPWLLYHAYLFGLENLYVYDNGSRDESVLAILRSFAAAGVNVDFSHPTMADFSKKGEIIGNRIKEFKNAGSYDMALALDCDEFVALAGAAGPCISRTEILAEIERIHAAGAICQTARCFYNVPGYLDQFWLARHWKCIVPVQTFRGIDHGFHRAVIAKGEDYGATWLTHFHLHHKPFDHLIDGVKKKLEGLVDISDIAALNAYRGEGLHLVKYLFMTREQYYGYLAAERGPFLRFSGFVRLLELFMDLSAMQSVWEAGRLAHGRDDQAVLNLDETRFSAAAYLAANPDLKSEPNLFYHYAEEGFAEGRPLEPKSSPREAAWAAMREGRHAEAITLWAKFRALFPNDPEGYDCGVIACRNAGADPDDIIVAARERFPHYFATGGA
jgi:hypothetical protein